MGTLELTVEQWPLTTQADETRVTVRITLPTRSVRWVNVVTLVGIQNDFLVTLLSEITTSWRYGERPKDVGRAIAGVQKMARYHAARHEF